MAPNKIMMGFPELLRFQQQGGGGVRSQWGYLGRYSFNLEGEHRWNSWDRGGRAISNHIRIRRVAIRFLDRLGLYKLVWGLAGFAVMLLS